MHIPLQETWNYSFEETHINIPRVSFGSHCSEYHFSLHLRSRHLPCDVALSCLPGANILPAFPPIHACHMMQRIAKCVHEHGGIQRFFHVSCLGAAPDAPSKRLRTKAAGEEVVRGELGDIATIFKLAHMVGL